ncbi:polysaccharide deacetylase family protein [uncultured Desulfobacter sp.]|uniref:polysaccharide deacetylase family protein n=1 Tax=uncultured Desulfobacter sp. TaxID=240139 RepID=UPI0029F5C990|nr:polysaccharide deacetylase family protein [uncultured Desulfobacter sp.]
MKNPAKRSLTTGERTGIGAFILAGFFFVLWGTVWSIFPLAGFVLLCLVAPFATGYSFFLPVICRGARKGICVSLSFDDGPDKVTTPLVLDILRSYQVKATFFVTGENARSHPDLIARILAQGHTIGNHTYSHDPLIMLKSRRHLKDEIIKTQEVLGGHGIRPLVFRPPAGITNPKLGPVLAEVGLKAVNFSCRAMDRGNRRISGLASKILGRVRPGDIILLHDSKPLTEMPDNQFLSGFLTELERVLKGLESQNISVMPLAELIGQPVMEEADPNEASL